MKAKFAFTSSIGGTIAWYDFVVYGFFSEIIADIVFPQKSPFAQTICISLVFAIGYLARPIGSLIFGHIGDRYGRKKSLFYSMILTGITTASIAITPSYAQIGILSSILFIIARLFQGFAAGGNTTGAIVYISEMAKSNRGFWISTTLLEMNRGIVLASIISSILFTYLTHKSLYEWGWRISFLAGLVIIIVAFVTRNILVETPLHEKLNYTTRDHISPIVILFSNYKTEILLAISLTSLFAIMITLLFFYMPTFLGMYGLDKNLLVHVNLIIAVSFSVSVPFFGWLCDKIGAKLVLIIAAIWLMIEINYCYSGLISGFKFYMYLGAAMLGVASSAIVSSTPTISVALFPTRVRYSGMSFAYNICCTIFSGLLPLIITSLSHYYSARHAISFLVIIAAIITITSCFFINSKKDFLNQQESVANK